MKNIWRNKMLLRILGLTMSFLMLCPYTGIAEETTAVKTILSSDEFTALKALGMTAAHMEFNSEDAMTRGDFAYVLARLAGYTDGYQSTRSFSDLPTTYENREAIGFLADMDVLTGAGNGAFNPEDNITYVQAAKMVVTALGYSAIAEVKYGGYPAGYLTMAQQLNLFRGEKSGSGNMAVTCEDAFEILYMTARAEVAMPGVYSDDGLKLAVQDGKTLLSVNHNIYRGEGVLTDNGITSLDDASELAEGGAIIGDVRLVSTEHGFNCQKLIGEYLEFWYNKEKETLIYAYSQQKPDSMLRIPYDKLITDDSDFTISTIVYENEKGDIEKAEISATHKMIYNDAAYPAHTASDLKIDSGYIDLIDIDEDGEFDIVRVSESLSDTIYYLDAEAGIIKTKYNQLMIELKEWENVSVLMADGTEGSIYELAINQPVSLYCSKDKTSLTIIDCSTSVVTGSLDELDAEGLEITVAGTSYPLIKSRASEVIAAVSTGSSYTFYRNADGGIFAVDTSTESGWTLAYCVGLEEKGTLDKTLRACAVTTDNRVLEYMFSDKIRVNGISCDALDLLRDNRFVNQTTGDTVRQVLRFKFDTKGNVREVEVAVDNSHNPYHQNLSEFSKDYDAEGSVRIRIDTVYIVAYTYFMTPDSHIFVDPYMDEPDSDGKTDGVECLKRTALSIHSSITHCEIYDLNQYLQITAMVTKRLGEGNNAYEGNILTIGRYTQVKNSDGEIVGKIRGVAGNSEVTYMMTPDCPIVGSKKIEPGYVFKFRRNRLGQLERLEFIYDLNDQSVRWTDPNNHPYNENMGYLYCPVYSASENGVVTLMPDSGISRGYTIMGTAFPNGKRNGALYDRKTKTLRLASGNDIYGAYVPDNDGSVVDDGTTPWIFIRRRNSYFSAYVLVIN